MKYRLIGYLVEAEQYQPGITDGLFGAALCGPVCEQSEFKYDYGVRLDHVHTPVGPMHLRAGDWLVRHPGDVFLVMGAAEFAVAYERVAG